MIPADIDNFIIDSINHYEDNYIRIIGKFNKIPKEIGNCCFLESIILDNNQIVDISALRNLTNLKYLNLSHNNIVDISALSNLTSLKYLHLSHNIIVDITALSNLTSPKYIYLYGNKINNKIKFNTIFKVIY